MADIEKYLKSFPDPEISNSEKNTKAYIGSYVRAAYDNWKSGGSADQYSDRSRKYRAKSYRMGTQSSAPIENLLNIEGDIVDLNLNYSSLPIAQKFADVVINNILNNRFKIKLEASDNVSKARKDDYSKGLHADMSAKPFEELMNQMTGLDLTKKGVPGDEEELEIMVEVDYRDPLEIGLETLIDMVQNNNEIGELRRKFVDDLVTHYEAAAYTRIDVDEGIVLDHVEAQNFIRSLSRNEDNRDLKFAGEIKKMTLAEVRNQLTPEDGITPDMLEELARDLTSTNGQQSASNNYDDPIYPDQMNGRNRWYDALTVKVVKLEFKDFNYDLYEKKHSRYGIPTIHKRGEGFKLSGESETERELFRDTYETVYKGSWIVGGDTRFLFDWGPANNILLEGKKLNKARLNYVVYTIQGKSIVERMIPYADQMWLSHIKHQQLIAKLRPSGVSVNVTALENALAKQGGEEGYYEPIDLMNYYDVSGNVLYRDDTSDDGAPRRGIPITPLDNRMGSQLTELTAVYNHNLEIIRDMTNVNKFVDGSMVSSKTLVGVQEKGIEQSNTGVYQISAGLEFMARSVARNIVCHGQDIFKYSDLMKAYEIGIGEANMEEIERIKAVPVGQINIKIEYEPTAEEKAALNNDINTSISQGELRIEDSIMIREIDNIRLANKMLIKRKEQYRKEVEEAQQAQAQAESEARQAEAQQKLEGEMQIFQAKGQAELQVAEMNNQFDVQKIEAEKNAKAELITLEYGYKKEIAEIEAKSQEGKLNNAENRKDSRISQTKTMESEIVDQKENKTGIKNFNKQTFDENMGIPGV